MLDAEKILMATGLVDLPTATHVRAADGLLADMEKELTAALDREHPGHLYVCPERLTYFDRLSTPPSYAAMGLLLERLVGTETSDAYQAIEGGVVEGLRLIKDLAAGALLKEEVDLFASCFPEAYFHLVGELDRGLAKRTAANKSWEPPMWLADSLRVFEGKPFGASLELTGRKEPPSPPAPKRGKAELDTDALKTKSQGG